MENSGEVDPSVDDTKVVLRNPSTRAQFKRKRSSLILEPLYAQVTSFVLDAARRHVKRGRRSKKSEYLMRQINNALRKLVVVGKGIALDYPEVRVQMADACTNVQKLGKFDSFCLCLGC